MIMKTKIQIFYNVQLSTPSIEDCYQIAIEANDSPVNNS